MEIIKKAGERTKSVFRTIVHSTVYHSKHLWGYVKEHKKVAIASVVTVGICVTGSTLANAYYTQNTTVLYRVYLNDKPIGFVDDPKVVRNWINEEIGEWKQTDSTLHYFIDGNITFSEEKIFKGKAENNEVIQALEKSTNVKVEAVKVVVDGETIGYAPDEKTLQQLLQEIKNEYTNSENDSQKKKSVVTIASYSSDSERETKKITDVSIKEEIDTVETEITPDQLMSKDELKDLLKTGTLEQKEYTVQEGDCLSCIANKFDMSVGQLLQNNPGLSENSLIRIGQKINVTAPEPKVTVTLQEKVEKIVSIDYPVEYRESDSMFKGDTKVIQEGREGQKKIVYEVTKENGIEVSRELIEEEVIAEPVKKIVVKGTKVVASRGSGQFAWPTYGGYISSNFGYRWGERHEGIDIARPYNRTIKAADNGRVIEAGWDGGYGKSIVIDHGNGYKTRYAHLSRIDVSVGQVVAKGQKIGIMGSTGNSTGVHLHFEVIKGGRQVNPLRYLN